MSAAEQAPFRKSLFPAKKRKEIVQENEQMVFILVFSMNEDIASPGPELPNATNPNSTAPYPKRCILTMLI
jgi:hypothetical protein